MKLPEKLSASIFRRFATPYLKNFKEQSIERVLRKSVPLLDEESLDNIRSFVKASQTPSGGFADKAGSPDIYYSLFGCFLAEALDMPELIHPVSGFLNSWIEHNKIEGIYLHCASILSTKLGNDELQMSFLLSEVRERLTHDEPGRPEYNAFLSLLSCYYLQYYKGLYLTGRKLKNVMKQEEMPSPVLSASLVLQKSFARPVEKIEKKLYSFYDGNGGFRATANAPIADLLSTAVSLYALHFAGSRLSIIKPACLNFVDSHFNEGGFCGTILDPDPDIEYTFYGLLALGSLSD